MKLEKSNNVLLFIEPKGIPTDPIEDALTKFVQNGLDHPISSGIITPGGTYIKGISSMSVHTCICGKQSESRDYEIYPGVYTHSLAAHYLRDHRSEVPLSEIDKLISNNFV